MLEAIRHHSDDKTKETGSAPLRIAQIAPLIEAVPPRLYGGTERVVAHLADALVTLGQDVTLFASGDARTRARLVAVRDQAIRLDPAPLKSELAAHLSMLHEVRHRADEFDVLHFHIDLLHFPFFEHLARRTLTTIHGRLDFADLAEAYRHWHDYPLVSISFSQRRPLPFGNWMATVHHGIPEDLFDFSPAHRGYLAFVGRISPEKRVDRAIEIAQRAGMPLRIAAKVDPVDAAYFRQEIKPLLAAPGVEYLGEIDDAGKNEVLGGAAALVFPIDWPEPFGLVMIEAMACGTPVIAWDAGSTREVIDEGASGCIVKSIDEAAEAVDRVLAFDRRRVRKMFERRFSAATMSKNYLRLYSRLVQAPLDSDDYARSRPQRRVAAAHGAVRA
ncbi:MAG TPA: glycosyltransferase family 4 protein [Casimicrobiaceae bacterium]|nr:glycosyltransferase family 4 protein [Casimicrobiaceae bacterium]